MFERFCWFNYVRLNFYVLKYLFDCFIDFFGVLLKEARSMVFFIGMYFLGGVDSEIRYFNI